MEKKLFDNAVLVVGHPDDEILWFSSILDKLPRIQICFHKNDNQQVSNGRENALHAYPLTSVHSFRMDEVSVYNDNHYLFPIPTRYGMLIYNPLLYHQYKKRYKQLIEHLTPLLSRYSAVFTHNPWGEYGHEIHVMVYQAVKRLQQKYHYTIYFNNYISTKSMELAKKYLFQRSFPFFSCQTNVDLLETIKALYIREGCWTWADKWEPFAEEAFLEESYETNALLSKYDHIPPLNIIKHLKYEKK